jgi:hypothetical protein
MDPAIGTANRRDTEHGMNRSMMAWIVDGMAEEKVFEGLRSRRRGSLVGRTYSHPVGTQGLAGSGVFRSFHEGSRCVYKGLGRISGGSQKVFRRVSGGFHARFTRGAMVREGSPRARSL